MKKLTYKELQEIIQDEATAKDWIESIVKTYMPVNDWNAPEVKIDLTGIQKAEACQFIALYNFYKLEGKMLTIDKTNEELVRVIAAYFSNDDSFIELAKSYGINSPSLEKGIVLSGGVGVGKTTLLQAFSANLRNAFRIYHSKDIARKYQREGPEGVEEVNKNRYVKEVEISTGDRLIYKAPKTIFGNKSLGVCVDDFGAESESMHFGTRCLVLADVIEARYFTKHSFPFSTFHLTTNLSPDEIKAKYGERVHSRFFEMFNFIRVGGTDRRKANRTK